MNTRALVRYYEEVQLFAYPLDDDGWFGTRHNITSVVDNAPAQPGTLVFQYHDSKLWHRSGIIAYSGIYEATVLWNSWALT